MARKTKAEAERTKQKLLESALEIMSDRSYASVSMTEIAERIGYSKGAVYWHFRNKHDLLIKLVDAACAKTGEVLAQAIGGKQSMEGLRCYYKSLIEAIGKNDTAKMFHKLMMHRQEWPEEVRGKVDNLLLSRIDNECKAIEKMLVNEQGEGKVRKDIPTKEIASVISAVFQGLFMFQIVDDFYKIDFAKYVDFLFDAIKDKVRENTA